jgi:hypothetical protein
VPAGNLAVEVLEQADPRVAAGICARGVARELDEVEAVLDREGAAEIGDEDETRLERRNEQRLLALVVPRDLGAQLSDTRMQLLPSEVDVTEPGLGPYDASSSWYLSASRSMSRL